MQLYLFNIRPKMHYQTWWPLRWLSFWVS